MVTAQSQSLPTIEQLTEILVTHGYAASVLVRGGEDSAGTPALRVDLIDSKRSDHSEMYELIFEEMNHDKSTFTVKMISDSFVDVRIDEVA